MVTTVNATLLALAFALAAGAASAQLRVPGSKFGAPVDPRASPPARPTAPGGQPQLVDRIVAVVNNDVITHRDLAERVAMVSAQLRRQGVSLPPEEVIERQVLERIISDRVQVQFARETGIRVDDVQVDRTLEMLVKRNNMTLDQFSRTLEREGVPLRRFREDMRDEIMISRLREREVDSKIQIAESEIDNYLEEAKNSAGGDVQYDVSHILVRVPENASPQQIDSRFERAREALARARAGGDFAELAVTYSDAPDGLQGGHIGWRHRDRLPELFVEAIVKLTPGQVSDVLRSPAGFHILKLNDRRGGGLSLAVEQTRVRHILIRVNEIVSEVEALRRLTVLRERIVGGASFAELARLNSDDTATAQRGGEIGWIVPGDVVPDFERAMNALKIGEVSQPVRTPFGYHLLQVEERRTADLSSDRKRIEARKVLAERRSDEAYQDWLRQLRDRAYVEVRLEDR